MRTVQKLLISSTAERDYSGQETCHILLQHSMFLSFRSFVVLSIDRSRLVKEHLDEDKPATALSPLDHYRSCDVRLLHSLKVRPCCTFVQKLMINKPFMQICELQAGFDNYVTAFNHFLLSGIVSSSLEEDVCCLQQDIDLQDLDDGENDEQESMNCVTCQADDWMLICKRHLQTAVGVGDSVATSTNWLAAARQYSNLEEAPSFLLWAKELHNTVCKTFNADIYLLQEKQCLVYNAVNCHLYSTDADPLRMIVSGTAGIGKSFLINCLKSLLKNKVRVAAPTGVAAFNTERVTVHSLLHLPVQSEFKELQGERLQWLQDFNHVDYLIIDEISMVGRKLFGQIGDRLCQEFLSTVSEILECSCLLVGNFGQLTFVYSYFQVHTFRLKMVVTSSSPKLLLEHISCARMVTILMN